MPTNPKPSQHALVCHQCGRVRQVTPEQQLKYVSKGWPKCCGAIMTLYLEVDRRDDGESLDSPESQPG
jgi:hypothetical protein